LKWRFHTHRHTTPNKFVWERKISTGLWFLPILSSHTHKRYI
jgi:hypothetical protein